MQLELGGGEKKGKPERLGLNLDLHLHSTFRVVGHI